MATETKLTYIDKIDERRRILDTKEDTMLDEFGNTFDSFMIDRDEETGLEYCWAYLCETCRAMGQFKGHTIESCAGSPDDWCGVRGCETTGAEFIYYLHDYRT